MVYNYGYPMDPIHYSYQQPMPQSGTSYVPQQPQQMAPQSIYIPVNSQDEVDRYQMAPNTSALFIDIPHQTAYAKSCDSFGVCKTVIFDMIERSDAKNDDRYVTKDEFEAFRKMMTEGKTNE